ncbi:MAG: hypothetical protein IK064_02915, partial [Clostridia bacterium]|nr:hypothetical protein [Clostridia bacterium]
MKTKLMRSSCILAALLAVLLFAAVLAPAAHAVSATRTYFFYNDVRRDIKVTVGYEGAEPNIQFIDFSRNTYDSDESFA